MAKRDASVGLTTPSQAAAIAEAYLAALGDIHATQANSPEVSYYPVLANLFNTVGKSLKPRVLCVMNLKNQGADRPDGGLFTADQYGRKSDIELPQGLLAARGAIEAKSTRKDVRAIAGSDQVTKYLSVHGIVLVTNLRDFLIVERALDGHPIEREAFSLANSEKDFWESKVKHPRVTAQQRGSQFIEFIKRACLHNAPLVNPKDVAWFLASYAKDALARVEQQKHLEALQTVRTALEEALGMKFTEERGEHFFRSTLVQTLFYGVFSAWVLWHRENADRDARFDWQKAAWFLQVPFIRTLYEEIAKASRLGPLGLVEVLDWAAGVLNRVERDEFFKRFADEHAVQYFYEPFLEAYDPELRRQLGVWYTPPEIVRYQVARVDTVLREELELPDGLADPSVIVLDPCCGTGAYLVEVLRRIASTLRGKGGDALIASDLRDAAMNRVFGFEILPAPFVVSHLQLGLMLRNEGAPLSQAQGQRVGVYLTNALTGWEPPKGPKQRLMHFKDLEEERDAAEQIKRGKTILVILGNPPYNAFAGVSPEEEQGLVEIYKGVYYTEKSTRSGPPKRMRHYRLSDPVNKGGWGIKKFNLDELYVRFFRLAERRIAEITGKGVISFISSFSYLSDPSFVMMRERLLAQFDKVWVDCMNGDSRETGKLTPDGKPDPSAFSTEHNREGIRLGTAVSVIVRSHSRQEKPIVRFRDFWGATKRADLLDSLNAKHLNTGYTVTYPCQGTRFSFRPESTGTEYETWPRLVEFCEAPPSNGLMEKRGGALIDIERDTLAERMRHYFDGGISWEEYRATHACLTENAARFTAQAARQKAIEAEAFDPDRLRRYALRPFDTRWCYYTSIRPVWNEPRPALWRQCFEGNAFVLSRMNPAKSPEGSPMYFCRGLSDDHVLAPDAVCFSLRVSSNVGGDRRQGELFQGPKLQANLSKSTRDYLARLSIPSMDDDVRTAGLIWMHALAIGYSPAYLTENADGIRRDWPHIPLPAERNALEASAVLGEQIAALLDTEAEVVGVTTGTISPLLKTIGLTTKIGEGELDLGVTAGWGHTGQGGVVMPAKGKLSQRKPDQNEGQAIDAEAAVRGMTGEDLVRLLGEKTCDVYLNDSAYWRNIPLNVWEYRIGGYQVIKKWLSYREQKLLGRPLKSTEAREVMNMARRIAAILLLQPKLDANYHAIKSATFAWGLMGKAATTGPKAPFPL